MHNFEKPTLQSPILIKFHSREPRTESNMLTLGRFSQDENLQLKPTRARTVVSLKPQTIDNPWVQPQPTHQTN
jgi:hypothetical protein